MKAHNHVFFWVEAEKLYETYETYRGRRFRFKKDVPGKPDCVNVDENGDQIKAAPNDK